MQRILRDERFADKVCDARFRDVPQSKQKVKIDKRFMGMFKDERFLESNVDKRGRLQNPSLDHLEKLYELPSSEEEEEEEKEEEKKEDDDEEEEDQDELANPGVSRLDLARGLGNVSSSSSDESSSEDEEVIHAWGEFHHGAETTTESTRRLALCNVNWKHVNAKDIYFMLSSFVPEGKVINSVKIYLSDYGRQQLAKEDLEGPEELRANLKSKKRQLVPLGAKHRVHDDEDVNDSELVRKYEINSMKYYYAVIDCEDVGTADLIYNNCDNSEIELTSMRLDLRFIPDDMEFNDEPVDMEASSADANQYTPKLLTCKNLEHSKVKLTWDVTDPIRTYDLMMACADDDYIEKDDNAADKWNINKYLASSSGEDSDLENDDDEKVNLDEEVSKCQTTSSRIAKYKELLSSLDEKKTDDGNSGVRLEVDWSYGLQGKPNTKSKAKQVVVKEQRKLITNEAKGKTVKEVLKKSEACDNDGKDELQSKLKAANESSQKKKQIAIDKQKAELELILADDDDGEKGNDNDEQEADSQEDNSKKSRKERKTHAKLQKLANKYDRSKDFKLNLNDKRFDAIYTSHLYHIDPTHQNYKETPGMKALMKEKARRRADAEGTRYLPKKQRLEDDQKARVGVKAKSVMDSLVKNIKTRVANQS